MKPTSEDKQTELKAKYAISHTDGSPCDPNAKYFVLRLDYHEGMDEYHIACCRVAAEVYARGIADHLPALSAALMDVLSIDQRMPGERGLKVRFPTSIMLEALKEMHRHIEAMYTLQRFDSIAIKRAMDQATKLANAITFLVRGEYEDKVFEE